VIPGNDDAIRSISLISRLIADAIIAGRGEEVRAEERPVPPVIEESQVDAEVLQTAMADGPTETPNGASAGPPADEPEVPEEPEAAPEAAAADEPVVVTESEVVAEQDVEPEAATEAVEPEAVESEAAAEPEAEEVEVEESGSVEVEAPDEETEEK
ncbi:MAG TPA: hypothetical protein VGP38_04480, partial [Rubrobacter sp.]|nr:hypothetical protein [Rubrobacter sp.]